MARFYLHVCNGGGFVEDEEGVELPDEQAARKTAILGLRDIMASEMRRGQLNTASFIEIEDEHHQLVMIVPFAEAVEISQQPGGRPPR